MEMLLLLFVSVGASYFAQKKTEERKVLKKAGSSRRAVDRVDRLAGWIEDFTPYAKILTSYLQVVCGLGFVLDLAFPPQVRMSKS